MTARPVTTLDGLDPSILASLQERWSDLPWSARRTEHGGFHQVLVLPPLAVVRVRRDQGHAAATRREARIATALARAGLPVPHPLSEPLHTQDWSATVFTLVDGSPREARTWAQDRAGVLSLLERWADCGRIRRALARSLPGARTWCGGERWPDLVERMMAPDPALRAAARRRIEDLLEAEPAAEPSVVHGDFGHHTILWGPEGAAMIDTDHAAWADPAIDVAPLLAAYSAEELGEDLPRPVVERAVIHRRTLSLQVAAAAEIGGDTRLRDHALGNFTRRVRSGDPRW